MKQDADSITWGDVGELIHEAHLDHSEYFQGEASNERLGELIWGTKTRPIAYWVRGGSEGWYVHVAKLTASNSGDSVRYEDVFVGKFWSRQDAAFAADLITCFMNGERQVDLMVDEGRARFP
jgi:hypothetical protein